jgi:hypothetical protein
MYGNELPTNLPQHVAKISDCALLTVGEYHHLHATTKKKEMSGKPYRRNIEHRILLTMISVLYDIEDARPKFGSRGLGGTGTSAPGISCVAGSSHAQAINWSTMTSWVLGPAATRRCFIMARQYSSALSCIIPWTRKTETSSCCAGCGSKKLWPFETRRQCAALRRRR